MGPLSAIRQRIGVDSVQLTDAQKVMVYREVTKSIEAMLDSDARKFSEGAFNVLIDDLTTIIGEIAQLKNSQKSNLFLSTEAVLAKLRSARSELYVASDMVNTKRTASYYRCIEKARSFLEDALEYY